MGKTCLRKNKIGEFTHVMQIVLPVQRESSLNCSLPSVLKDTVSRSLTVQKGRCGPENKNPFRGSADWRSNRTRDWLKLGPQTMFWNHPRLLQNAELHGLYHRRVCTLALLTLLSHCETPPGEGWRKEPVAENRNNDIATLGKFHAAQGEKMFLLKPLRFNGARRATSYEGFRGGAE